MATATWHEGDTEQLVVTVTEDGTNVTSLAGTTITFALYNSAGTAVLSKSTVDFVASAPTLTCDLDATDLDGLSGVYEYEIRVTDTNSNTQSAVGQIAIVGMTS